MLYFLKFPHRK